MTDKHIVLIGVLIAALAIAYMWGKAVLIWRDSKLDELKRIEKELDKIIESKKQL